MFGCLSKGKLTLKTIETTFSNCGDFKSRIICVGGGKLKAGVCFIDGLVNSELVSRDILRPLTDEDRFKNVTSGREAINMILTGSVYSYSLKDCSKAEEVVEALVNGFCAIVFDQQHEAVVFEVQSGEKRAVGEPVSEKVVKGSRDAFVETFRVNTSLVRKKLRGPDLKIIEYSVGRRSKTKVGIVYVDGITNPELVEQTMRRIGKIDIDGLLAPGNLEDYIVDNPNTPFPQIITTERPDKFCMNLLEGRVGILVDGLPMGFLLPGTFAQFIKVPEDNAGHYLVASALTLLRYISVLITVCFPAFYVAIAMYHQEMIPTNLMLAIIESKENVPFSTAIEVLGMLVAFEILQEASLHLPQPVGETVGIIGALVVGQSAVEAQVISPVVVIVVATAGITGYTIPDQDLSAALRLCRLLFVFAALFMGVFGIVIALLLLVYHLSTIEVMGVPYMTPFAEGSLMRSAKALIRWPLPASKERDISLHPQDMQNQR